MLQSGFSHCRALLWNFLSATTAIIGFFIGSYTSDSEGARQWIFAATIGMFLYIALVDLVYSHQKTPSINLILSLAAPNITSRWRDGTKTVSRRQ